ncbi:MAG: GNAT family N-acetyltransferase [Comamonadaceae bacterium]|nr:GNAT family N-acetyltransferase [Comamonadaceae bacterium]
MTTDDMNRVETERGTVALCRLAACPPDLCDEIHRVCLEAPNYFLSVEGQLPDQESIKLWFSEEELPFGCTSEHHNVFSIGLGDALIGVAHILAGCRDPEQATIGLLLLSEQHQGQGLGRAVFRHTGSAHARMGHEIVPHRRRRQQRERARLLALHGLRRDRRDGGDGGIPRQDHRHGKAARLTAAIPPPVEVPVRPSSPLRATRTGHRTAGGGNDRRPAEHSSAGRCLTSSFAAVSCAGVPCHDTPHCVGTARRGRANHRC